MTRQVSFIFCTCLSALVFIAPACGRRNTPVALPIAAANAIPVAPRYETLFAQGLSDFHLGTPEGYARAADSFRKAWALKPATCEYALNLAQSLFFLSTEELLNWEEYEPHQTEARSVVDSVAGACTSSHEPFVLRLRALIAGRGPGAGELINRAVDLDPADAMNWVVLGQLDPMSRHLVTSDGTGRWVAMTHAVELLPDSALIQYEFGKNYPSFRGKANESRQAFERAIQRSPRHFRSYLALAYAADENTDAEPLYKKVVDIAPDFLEGRMALGGYYGALDAVEEAAAQYSATLALNPKFDTAHYMLGRLMLDAGRAGEAELHFIAVTELNRRSFESYYYLGNISYGRSDYEKAKARYDEALKIVSNYVEAEYGVGHVFRQQNQIDLAEAQFEKVIKIRPLFGDAYMSRADVRAEKHQFAAALTDYRKAIETYEEQLVSLNASIAAAEAHSESRLFQAEKKRNQRDKARTEALLEKARQYRSEMEEILKGTPR